MIGEQVTYESLTMSLCSLTDSVHEVNPKYIKRIVVLNAVLAKMLSYWFLLVHWFMVVDFNRTVQIISFVVTDH